MPIARGLIVFIWLGLFSATTGARDVGAETQVRIGVLAHRGVEAALQSWQPTAAYLTRTIPRYDFQIVPLTNATLNAAVAQGHIDFIITNPGSYAVLEARFGATRMLTLRNLRQGGAYTRFGAVIFTRADRHDIETLTDLRTKSFMAVRPDAFGGYLMALRELREAGVDPQRHFSRLTFAGLPQDNIVFAVRSGEIDAGTVRTDTLERMAAEGLIALNEFKVINQQNYPGFPFYLSTRLYPEWAFARTTRTNEQLAHEVGVALLQLAPDGPEARMSQSAGWTVPLDYTPVHDLLRELRIGPYEDLDRIDLAVLLRQYWYWFLVSLGMFSLLAVVTGYIMRINHRLSVSQARMSELTRELEESNRVLQQLSAQDDLTGLANHRSFEDAFTREWGRCGRLDVPLSLMMIDIDHFKLHNDRYGHLAGDQCLRQVAAALRSTIRRPTDLAARYGGEEFTVLLPETDAGGAFIVAERVREAVEALSLETNEGEPQPHVTVSVGVATVHPTREGATQDLIAAADGAMYQAKAAGRNRVVAHEPARDVSADTAVDP